MTEEAATATTATDNASRKEEVIRRLEREVAELGERIQAFQNRVKETAGETRTRFRPVAERLRANWQAMRATVERLRTVVGEVSSAVIADLEQGRDRLKSELASIRTELEIETAETKAAYRDALQAQLDTWRGRIDELRVQADLAEMEARDELTRLLDDVERAYRAAQSHLDQAGDHTAETLETLRRGTRQILGDVEAALEAAAKKLSEGRQRH
ncbi:MAG: hypothetical protein AB1679_01780 [Actinomycetota bacterium]|jgi:SMC interacting uncharacterized protein involved in chromosome segregation